MNYAKLDLCIFKKQNIAILIALNRIIPLLLCCIVWWLGINQSMSNYLVATNSKQPTYTSCSIYCKEWKFVPWFLFKWEEANKVPMVVCFIKVNDDFIPHVLLCFIIFIERIFFPTLSPFSHNFLLLLLKSLPGNPNLHNFSLVLKWFVKVNFIAFVLSNCLKTVYFVGCN